MRYRVIVPVLLLANSYLIVYTRFHIQPDRGIQHHSHLFQHLHPIDGDDHQPTLRRRTANRHPQQGVIIVDREYYDSCSAQAERPQNANYTNPYLTPYLKGGIRMTAIQGPNILFTTQDGASGSFNFVTDQFS